MRTALSPDNPYGPTRHGFAWQRLPAGGRAHLDFGCYDGAFLASLAVKGMGRLVGVDAAPEPLEAGRRALPGLDLRHVPEEALLPFEDASFTSVSLLDVLEHVYDQDGLLAELGRVLAPEGRLVVTVPRQYAFSFTDLGNLKFRFPRLHRWAFCLAHSRSEWERRYGGSGGLVGDISARKRWHEHFTPRKLQVLLARAGFRIIETDGSGFFTRPLSLLLRVMGCIPVLRRLSGWFSRWDARHFESMNLFCVAVKEAGPQTPGKG